MRNPRLAVSAAGLLCALAGVANGQISPIGPFTGPYTEGFEDGAQTIFLPCIPQRIFNNFADMCTPGNSGTHTTSGWGFMCTIFPNSGGRFYGSAGGFTRITFDAPVSQFGGYFGTNCGTDGGQITFYDDSMNVIGTEMATTAGCTWTWNGWQSTTPIKSIDLASNAFGGAFLDMDDLEYGFGTQSTGACCLPSGSCVVTTQSGCTGQNGLYRGDNSPCATANCPQPPTGACCHFDGSCTVVTEAQCTAGGGTYQGNGTACGSCPPPPPVIYRNCNLGTGPTTLSGVGGLPAGTQWSEVAQDSSDPTTANTTAGFGGSGALRLADDFDVPTGGMNLGYVHAFAYLTGATSPGVTAATLQIWNGPPNDPNSTVIFGDTTTNRLASNSFAPYFRTFNTVTPPTCGGATTAPGQTRHVQDVYLTVNQMLPAGHYWIDFNYTGASFSPPSTSSTAIGRQCDPNNANGLQYNGGWVPLADAGQGCNPTPVNQDIYFELLGTAGGPSCYANCDGSTGTPFLNVNDFICFQSRFAAGDSYANCDGSTNIPVLNVNDFICFQSSFAAGCSAP